jgi:hypothetical protein
MSDKMVEITKPEIKTIKTPPREVMASRLNEFLRSADIVVGARSFYEKYTERLLQYRNLNARGLLTLWNGADDAACDVKSYSPIVAMKLGLSFDAAIKILVPELADEAIRHKNQSLLRI